jgi:hypothetical protein
LTVQQDGAEVEATDDRNVAQRRRLGHGNDGGPRHAEARGAAGDAAPLGGGGPEVVGAGRRAVEPLVHREVDPDRSRPDDRVHPRREQDRPDLEVGSNQDVRDAAGNETDEYREDVSRRGLHAERVEAPRSRTHGRRRG